MIPFIYLFRSTLTLILVAKLLLVSTPSFIGRSLQNTITWMHYFSTHVLLYLLIGIYHTVQTPLSIIMSTPLWQLTNYWPKFYCSLFKPNPSRRSIWTIFANLDPVRAKAYAHLHQKKEDDLGEVLRTASSMYIYEDPLQLAIPDPPDGILLRMFPLGLIYFVFLYPILVGTIRLTSRTICKAIRSHLTAITTIFVQHDHRHCKQIPKRL